MYSLYSSCTNKPDVQSDLNNITLHKVCRRAMFYSLIDVYRSAVSPIVYYKQTFMTSTLSL